RGADDLRPVHVLGREPAQEPFDDVDDPRRALRPVPLPVPYPPGRRRRSARRAALPRSPADGGRGALGAAGGHHALPRPLRPTAATIAQPSAVKPPAASISMLAHRDGSAPSSTANGGSTRLKNRPTNPPPTFPPTPPEAQPPSVGGFARTHP